MVQYSEAWCEAHYQFARKMWPQRRRRAEETLIRWKFRGPKSGELEGLLLAVDENGAVLGQLGLIPAMLWVNGQVLPCNWACDLMVDNDVRRMGIASRLFEVALSRGVVTLGSNPSPAADATMRRIGFRLAQGPWTMVLPLKPAEVIRWKLSRRYDFLAPALGLLAEPGARLMRWRLHFSGGEIAKEAAWESLVELIEAAERKITCPHIVHDRGFLRWRCEGLEGFNPTLRGWRWGDGYAITGQSGNSLRVYDWHAGDETTCQALFRSIYGVARCSKVSTMMTMAQTKAERAWLISLGFLPMRTRVAVLYHTAQALPEGSRFRYAYYDSDGDI